MSVEKGRYGGTPTILRTLPVGTKFWVYNGSWEGRIMEQHGEKCLSIGTHRVIPLIGENENYELDIEIQGTKKEEEEKW